MDNNRMAQLYESDSTPKRSFVIRSSSQLWSEILNKPFTKKSMPSVRLVQAGISLQNNNNLPIGWNDGSLYPSVGMQQRFTLGAHFQWHNFSLHLQPEWVSAANKNPVPFESDPRDGNYIAKYYTYFVNKIDHFSRFGTEPLRQFFPGQSSFRFNTKNISYGISTENLWWGPGIRNSLVLTNNAPGFLHLTINSRKPIPTRWGNMEFQVVMGRLRNASTEAPDNALMRTIWADGIAEKPQANRAIFGYIFSFNPKFATNLHIGITGASYFYTGVVTPKPSVLLLDAENKAGSASLGALFFRYAMPKEHAEVYLEYGRANRWAAPWNVLGDTIPTGYTAGFRKIFYRDAPARNGVKTGILFGMEITQLQLPDVRSIFNPIAIYGIPKTNSWYTNAFNAQGFTNRAQVMGASIGPGSNSQTLNISWVKGMKRIGVQAERITYNMDFYTYNYFNGIVGSGTANKQWADLNLAFNFQWDYKQLLFSASVQNTSSLNYRWTKLEDGFAEPSPLSDKRNTQIQVGLSYFFVHP
jgi:hypothetical protein